MQKFPFQKIKQLLALIGVILLLALYAATLVCALSKSGHFMNLLLASVYATVIIPVLIWAYSFIYRLLKKYYGKKDSQQKEEP